MSERIYAGMTITCPNCRDVGDEIFFRMSCADECFCPRCGIEFMLEEDDDSD